MRSDSLGLRPVLGAYGLVEGCAMRVYTVKKPEPNTDHEFQAYIDLLEEIGIDITDVPRTPEPGTTNRWLYVWRSKPQAERFARELGGRLRDPSWAVHEFDIPDEERGPAGAVDHLGNSNCRRNRISSGSEEPSQGNAPFPKRQAGGRNGRSQTQVRARLRTTARAGVESSHHGPDWYPQ